MEIKKPIERKNIAGNVQTANKYKQLSELLTELEQHKLTDEIVELINQEIGHLNSVSEADTHFLKTIKEKKAAILTIVRKKLKVVPRNYHRQRWLVLGVVVFGLPIGFALSSSSGNMGLLGIGLPIGMAIGLGIGSGIDQKVFQEGKQLDFKGKN